MKGKHIMKVLALALAVALALAPPLLNAQSDGFFEIYSEGTRSGDVSSALGNMGFGSSGGGFGNDGFGDTGGGFGNDGFGETGGGITNDSFTAPLGSGIAILVASAAGYTLLKRRKSSTPQTPDNLKHQLKHQ